MRLSIKYVSWVRGNRPSWDIQNEKGNAGAHLTDEEIEEFRWEFFLMFRDDLAKGKKYPFSSWNREFIERLKKT